MSYMTLVWTALLTSAVWGMGIAIFYVVYMIVKRQYFIDAVIRTHTAGKPTVAVVPAKIYRSKKYGEIILGKLKGRLYIMPRFDNDMFMPGPRGRQIIDLTSKDGAYYVNKWREADAEEIKNIARKYGVAWYDSVTDLINPVEHTDRSWMTLNEQMVNDITKEKRSLWQNPYVAGFLIIVVCALIGGAIIVFSEQFATSLLDSAKAATGVAAEEGKNIAEKAVAGVTQPK